MASGKQLAAEYIERFEKWTLERYAANDFKEYVRGRVLNRSEIARECEFGTSALRQNPAIKVALDALENDLRKEGILPANSANPPEKPMDSALESRIKRNDNLSKNRIKALEEQNAALKAELQKLTSQLKQYKMREKHLSETGRMLML